MKNIYSIGRDTSCDIILDDDSHLISRVHAYLRVLPKGDYVIIDQSLNGTFVNGIRINSGVEVPISRIDDVSFAQVAYLDWDLVPDIKRRNRKIRRILIGAFLGLGIALGCGYFLLRNPEHVQVHNVVNCDSLENRFPDTVRTVVIKTGKGKDENSEKSPIYFPDPRRKKQKPKKRDTDESHNQEIVINPDTATVKKDTTMIDTVKTKIIDPIY